jgi:hypothetical protein
MNVISVRVAPPAVNRPPFRMLVHGRTCPIGGMSGIIIGIGAPPRAAPAMVPRPAFICARNAAMPSGEQSLREAIIWGPSLPSLRARTSAYTGRSSRRWRSP